MATDRQVRVSKYLSKYLRHEPEKMGLTLAPGGWVGVEELLAAAKLNGFPISPEELRGVVASSDKQRFSFDPTGTLIRANQGHSTEVDLQLEPIVPPPMLYHGTIEANLPSIRKTGLQKMQRHHVHLSKDEATATKVGARRGKPVILQIDTLAMHNAGHVFYVSANGVWLVDAVPPEFIS